MRENSFSLECLYSQSGRGGTGTECSSLFNHLRVVSSVFSLLVRDRIAPEPPVARFRMWEGGGGREDVEVHTQNNVKERYRYATRTRHHQYEKEEGADSSRRRSWRASMHESYSPRIRCAPVTRGQRAGGGRRSARGTACLRRDSGPRQFASEASFVHPCAHTDL